MRILYNLGIRLYQVLILIASVFKPKAKQWIKGRMNWEASLTQAMQKAENVVWVHCASLGEFEQARPLIEALNEKKQHFILLSFFSPSGYEAQKNYNLADYVCYLPIDSPQNAKRFLEISRPKTALFIKYEFWYNYLSELKNREIPSYLVSGIFRPSQHFFAWYGSWYRKQLHHFTALYVQNKQSFDLLKKIGLKSVFLSADTRFDRVNIISRQPFQLELLDQFCDAHKVMVIGSSWEAENKFALQLRSKFPKLKIVIAPHEVELENIIRLKERFQSNCILLSELPNEMQAKESTVLIIDQIGLLSKLYRYADFALVGGGFGKGIHNILEASAYGIPVLIGPKNKKFQEAQDLIRLQAVFEFGDEQELISLLKQLLENEARRTESGKIALKYIQSKLGATAQVIEGIFH